MLLKDMVSDGYFPSLIVDPDWYEGKHPQESLPEIEDPVSLWRPAPERDQIGAVVRIQESIAFGFELGAPSIDIVEDQTPGAAFANVQFLAGWNGADGATSFTEESQNAQVQTFVGNAQLDTAQSKFDGASLLLDGAADAVTSPDIPAINIGSSDFCIESFVRFSALPPFLTSVFWLSHVEPNTNQRSWAAGILNLGTMFFRFIYTTDGATNIIIDREIAAPSLNVWTHFANTRSGNDFRSFVDGNQQGAIADLTGVTFHNSTHVLTIGALGNNISPNGVLDGHTDESRLVIGEPVYTGNFSPPSSAFPRS